MRLKSQTTDFYNKIEATRKFNDLSNVRATVSIATYVFSGEDSSAVESVD